MSVTVTNPAQLTAALNAPSADGLILLTPGNYGVLNLTNKTYASEVTVRSADPANRATFDRLTLTGVAHLSFEDIAFVRLAAAGVTQAFVVSGSSWIAFRRGRFEGDLIVPFPADYGGSGIQGLVCIDSDEITVDDCDILRWGKGVRFIRTAHTLTRSRLYEIDEDIYNSLSCPRSHIVGNHFGTVLQPPGDTSHRDTIQFWQDGPAADDVLLESNWIDAGAGNWSQSVFMTGTILAMVARNNLIYNAHVNGITTAPGVFLGERNTLIDNPVAAVPANPGVAWPQIRLTGGGSWTLNGNVTDKVPNGSYAGSGNVVISSAQLPVLYQGGTAIRAGGTVPLDAFRPIPGSAVDGVGCDIDQLIAAMGGQPQEPPVADYLTITAARVISGPVTATIVGTPGQPDHDIEVVPTDPDYVGAAVVEYDVLDQDGLPDTTTLTVTYQGSAPDAQPDTVTVGKGVTIRPNVLANDLADTP